MDEQNPRNDNPLLCLGDFNEVLYAEGKRGKCAINLHNTDMFQKFMGKNDLGDLGFEGYRFTWSNKRKELEAVEERLDRGLANRKWRQCWGKLV